MTAELATSSDMLPRQQRLHRSMLDYGLLAAGVGLLLFGTLMVGSASMSVRENHTGGPFFYLIRHLIALGIGTFAALVLLRIPIESWQKNATKLYFIGLFLLVLVLIPGLGRTVNGATRWVPLGPFSLQSSEFMKLFMVVFIAAYLVRRQEQVCTTVMGSIKPLILMGIAGAMIIKQPDFGTTAVMLGTGMGLLFLGGAPLWQFGVLLATAATGLVGLIIFSPYRLQRVLTFLDPWADPYNKGFQLTQSLIAFGRGEWLGVGLGNSIQKQYYLPEAHTDFLLAVIGEEFGLVGTLSVMLLLGFICWRAFQIGATAMREKKPFAGYLASGIGLWLGLQAIVNIGVNLGLFPTKGLTLPLMSYGGNSIIVGCILLAVLLRADRETRVGNRSLAQGGS